ncbi:hypothetical protein BZA77DRAFT_35644 [Pyronema omphalodes]|nr:hypothetical protein BZA77DRAFT_35644 [Pyronema omphalodes]
MIRHMGYVFFFFFFFFFVPLDLLLYFIFLLLLLLLRYTTVFLYPTSRPLSYYPKFDSKFKLRINTLFSTRCMVFFFFFYLVMLLFFLLISSFPCSLFLTLGCFFLAFLQWFFFFFIC